MPPRVLLNVGLIAATAVGLLGVGLIAASREGVVARITQLVNESPDTTLSAPTDEPAAPEQRAGAGLAAPRNPNSIAVGGAWLLGWALLDTETGVVAGSRNSATMTNTVESMIKPWIAADHLRRLAEGGREPSTQTLKELNVMIVDSNDPMAEKYYQIGGSDAVIERLISLCGLTQVRIKTTLWSWTEMTPQDAVAYGQCLADGRAASPRWTSWVLDAMKKVRGGVTDQLSGEVQGGHWGIVDGLPPSLAQDTSIKNGWTLYKDGWHINCLAVHPDWTLAVMLRTGSGLQAGANACKSVAAALVVNP